MTEGFDVMFEMSGSAQALRAGIGQMAHGGRIAVLGIPSTAVELDLDPVIFNMLTLKGIYGREMYETWYQMSVMIDSGLDIAPVDHASVRLFGARRRPSRSRARARPARCSSTGGRR